MYPIGVFCNFVAFVIANKLSPTAPRPQAKE
jgi:hypothetical protein